VATPGSSSTNAQVWAIGGNDGTQNLSTVLATSVDPTGNVGFWIPQSPLPTPAAFAAVAEADPTNARVPFGSSFIYVVGGQQVASGTPGGTSTVYMGTVNEETGTVVWTTTSSLPESRVGASAVVFAGSLYVTGGLGSNGNSLAQVASAPINTDGTLGTFKETGGSSNLPTPVAFHQSFASGGFLYVVGGDTGPVTPVFAQTIVTATASAFFAPIEGGNVGAWTTTGGLSRPREKFVLFNTANQVLVYEGNYGSTTDEGEFSSIGSGGQLAAFTPLSGTALPGANVTAAGGVTSPIATSASMPRFLFAGGEMVATPGQLEDDVFKGGP
jgi:hypothetical protein